MGQDSATQIATQLLLDVVRKLLAALLTHRGEEGLEVLAHDEMQGAVLRQAPIELHTEVARRERR
jgi:hypothetical protein